MYNLRDIPGHNVMFWLSKKFACHVSPIREWPSHDILWENIHWGSLGKYFRRRSCIHGVDWQLVCAWPMPRHVRFPQHITEVSVTSDAQYLFRLFSFSILTLLWKSPKVKTAFAKGRPQGKDCFRQRVNTRLSRELQGTCLWRCPVRYVLLWGWLHGSVGD